MLVLKKSLNTTIFYENKNFSVFNYYRTQIQRPCIRVVIIFEVSVLGAVKYHDKLDMNVF